MSRTRDSTLADPQQIIADLQRQLAESEAQKAAMAEVLSVINASPSDLTPVFDAMLEKALALCEAAFGMLWINDGDCFRMAAQRGLPVELKAFMQRPMRDPPEGSGLRRLIDGEAIAHVADISAEPLPTTRGNRAALVELGGARTQLEVALRKDDELLGVFHVYRQEVRPFTDEQIALLQNFAAQAVIAMENARLITETREALEQQTATAEVLGVINSSPGDLIPVFDAILEKAHSLCGAAHGVLVVREGEMCHAVAARGQSEQFAAQLRSGFPLAGNPVAAPLLAGAPFVQLADLSRVDHPVAEAGAAVGLHTLVAVPLRREETLLGYIVAARTEVRPFTDKQIALLQNFAAQAVIAMENARLITETREALEQQTATAEVLQVINSSPGDLTPVFDAILEKAHTLCGADSGGLVLIDGEQYRPIAVHGKPTFTEHWVQLGWIQFALTGTSAQLRRGEPLHVPDLAAYSGEFPEPVKRIIALSGAQSMLWVPLRKDGVLFAGITALREAPQPFTDKQIALLQNFAAQAVIAMENARLITETREALEQQTATAEVLQVINSSPGDLAPVFEAIVEKALTLCEASEGVLRTFDGENFNLIAGRGETDDMQRLRQLGSVPKESPIWEPLVRGERIVQFIDARTTEAYRERPGTRERVDLLGIRTWLAIALHKEDALLGAIAVYRPEVRPFTDKQIALLQNFAAQAVIAMENARLLGELRQRTDEVAELNRGLEARVAEQVEELGRVGRLKRFLAPQLAELIVSQGDEKILESHRREIVVVFCDLRGYTAFTETAEPEEVLDFLREYHGALGPLVAQFEGTLDQFSGDGIMVFFNDPVPIPDPAERAVKMAMAMREAAGDLIAAWRRRGRELGFGAGIAQGYATLGQIGFAERSGYTAIGTVCNVAARLCAEAKDGQILLSQRVAVAAEGIARLEEVGALTLKGLMQPVMAYNVPLAGGQAALHVIEGGAPSA